MKKQRLIIDYLVILIFVLWVIGKLLDVFQPYNTIVDIATGILYAILFSICVASTITDYKKIRFKALVYAINFIIALPCALKIMEITKDIKLPLGTVSLSFAGVFLQSLYFAISVLLKKRPRTNNFRF